MPETCIVKCPSCDNSLEFPREIAGHETDCPVCGGKVKLEAFVEQTTKVNIAPKTRRKLPSPRRIVDWIWSLGKPTNFPTGPSPNIQTKDDLQQEIGRLRQRVNEFEKEKRSSAIVISIIVLSLTLLPVVTIEILMTYVIPQFKTFISNNLGPGETLPEFTLLVLHISDTIRHNAIASLPIALVFAWFMGFKSFLLSRPLCRVINLLSITMFIGVYYSIGLAMSLTLFKLGQGP
jgi:hypothetical protein